MCAESSGQLDCGAMRRASGMSGRAEGQVWWDDFDVYLFDVDGTLLQCEDAVHYFAFCNALSAVAGRPVNLDGVTAHGNTDAGILRDAFALAGIAEFEWRPRLGEIYARMCGFVEAHRDKLRVHALPMAREVVTALRSGGRVVGIATGNLESIGNCKLAAAGLDDLFDFAAWSDGLEQRADVFARAVEMARAYAGADARIVAVGDTPADVRAAHANGLAAIAVATGIYSYEELQSELPDLCIHSFEALTISA